MAPPQPPGRWLEVAELPPLSVETWQLGADGLTDADGKGAAAFSRSVRFGLAEVRAAL